MKDDMMQMIKEKLLNELIDKMSDGDSRMAPPKGVGVEVQAPDKEHLAEGLDKARELVGKGGIPDAAGAEHSPEDDEERMLQLLSEDDDHDGDEY